MRAFECVRRCLYEALNSRLWLVSLVGPITITLLPTLRTASLPMLFTLTALVGTDVCGLRIPAAAPRRVAPSSSGAPLPPTATP